MVLRTRRQGLTAYLLWFLLGYLLLVRTGLVENTVLAAAVVVSSLSKDYWDSRRGVPAGPWYLDHYPLVMYVLAYTVCGRDYGTWNTILFILSSATAVVDIRQDWFRFTR